MNKTTKALIGIAIVLSFAATLAAATTATPAACYDIQQLACWPSTESNVAMLWNCI